MWSRQKASGAEGDRLKEATSINKSLSTLGWVCRPNIVVKASMTGENRQLAAYEPVEFEE